jgi:hypothetical protein
MLTGEEYRFGRFQAFEALARGVGGIGNMANFLTKPAAAGTVEAASVIAKAQVDAQDSGTDRVVSVLTAANLQREQQTQAIEEVNRTLDRLPAGIARLFQPQGL